MDSRARLCGHACGTCCGPGVYHIYRFTHLLEAEIEAGLGSCTIKSICTPIFPAALSFLHHPDHNRRGAKLRHSQQRARKSYSHPNNSSCIP